MKPQGSLNTVLAMFGLRVNLEAFKGVNLNTKHCFMQSCDHPSGPLPAYEFIRDTQNMPPACDILGLTDEFGDLWTTMSTCELHFESALWSEDTGWNPGWDKFVLPIDDTQTCAQAYQQGWEKLLDVNIETVNSTIKEFMPEANSSSSLPLVNPDPEALYYARVPLDSHPENELPCRAFWKVYGPAPSGTVLVPAKFLQKTPIDYVDDAPLYMGFHGFLAKEPDSWHMGSCIIEEPVQASQDDSPALLETAAVLAETLTLKEAFEAAREVEKAPR